MNITADIKYVGVNDHDIDLFEGQYIVPNGMAYNSYVIVDEKIAVMDTVDVRFCEQWLDNIAKVTDGKKVDYLIIQHMEPDHSANIAKFMELNPQTTIVATQKAFVMMNQFFAEYGPDSFIGRLASVIQGSSDTTLYVLTLYFGSIGVVKSKYALKAGLIADFMGIVASIIVVQLFFG